jgi:creatinine amidohydrolase
MLALAPGSVRMDLMAGADDEDRTGGLVFRYTAESLSTNGVTGRPSQATLALGDRLLAFTVDAICELVDRGRAEEPPLVAHAPDPSRAAMATGPILDGSGPGGSPC